MPTPVNNPFAGVYSALWTLFERSSELTSRVRPGNRIRFDRGDGRQPVKHEVSNADLPEVLLLITSSEANMSQTSCSSRITRQYDFLMATGDLDIAAALLDLEWYFFCGMHDWRAALADLTFMGSNFVKVASLAGINHGMSDPERNRGIAGWSSVWGVSVEMHFKTSDLIAVGSGS